MDRGREYKVYGAPPPGYYAPQPYGMPVPMVVQPNDTIEGVKFLGYYFLVTIISDLIGVLVFLAALGSPAASTSLSCIMSILSVVGFLMWIIGMWKTWEGRNEHGQQHAENVKNAVILFVIIIVITIVSVAGITFIAMTMVFSGGLTGGNLLGLFMIPAILGIVTAIFYGVMYTLIVKQFINDSEKGKMNLGIILMVVGSIISVGVTYIILRNVLEGIDDYSYGAYMGGALQLLAMFLFYQVYKAVHMRMVTGQIKPQMRVPPPMMGMAPYPAPVAYGPPPSVYAPPPSPYEPPPPPGYNPPPR